ncbi:MAG: guanylate kinase [Candidatus Chromulinivorax sp.]
MKTNSGKLFIVSGPSGVGKTTIVNRLLQEYQDYSVQRVITYTTKQARVIEKNGIDYHFISEQDFKSKIEEDFFLEWSNQYGAYYGTPKHVVQDIAQGWSAILIIDRVGALQILKKYPDAILIWMKVSSIKILSARLHRRKSETLEQIQRRLFLAEQEIKEESEQSVYHHHIDNDSGKSALQAVCNIILPHCFFSKKDIFKKN